MTTVDVEDSPAPNGTSSAAARGVKSGYRVIQVLEYFRDNPGPARNADIASGIGIPGSSTNELLKTLVETGYLAFDPRSKRYSLSIQFLTLADAVSRQSPAMRGLVRAAEALHDQTGESVALLVRNGLRMQFLFHRLGSYGDRADRVPILGTSAGGALLMTMPTLQVVSTVKMATRCDDLRFRRNAISEVPSRIAHFRAQGFAVSDASAHPPGVRAIAIPVELEMGHPPVIFGFGGLGVGDDLSRDDTARAAASMMRSVVHQHMGSC